MPSNHKPQILTGLQLVKILQVTTTSVKMLSPKGRVLGRIQPECAVLIVKAGSYSGSCSRTRVFYIRELEAPKSQVPDYTYRIGRPMINAYPVKDIAPWEKWAARSKSSRLEHAKTKT